MSIKLAERYLGIYPSLLPSWKKVYIMAFRSDEVIAIKKCLLPITKGSILASYLYGHF